MSTILPSLIALTGIFATSSLGSATPITQTFTRDVVVVGGGAGGAYAAARLSADYGKSVALIEKVGRLGGAVDTWIDPTTGTPYELGVEEFLDYRNATSFFAQFNVSIDTAANAAVIDRYANFGTGRPVNYTAPTSDEQFAAFETYTKLAEQYEDMMLPGLWNFPNASDFPPDLLLPFEEFATKYGIQAAVPTIWEIADVGLGDIRSTPTFFVLQNFPAPLARVFIGQGRTVYVASLRNQDIYDKVAEFLGDNVFYNSTVVSANRTSTGVTVIASGPDGSLTEIKAKRLLIAIPPTIPNLLPFNLDAQEYSTLSKVQYTNAYAGGVVAPNLPLNTTTFYETDSGDWLDYPNLPFVQWFKNLDSPEHYHKVMVFGNETFDMPGAQAIVEQSYENLVATGFFNGTGEGLGWLHFTDHGMINIRVSLEDLKAGFIQEFYGLQGHLSTWYAGAAWAAQLHTPTWAFSDSVVSRLVDDM
ncbi:hypothetical protein ZTR_10699 [Talaromyces verruculosus]|nr:hypothetical protein ZTR_10699 [Talaromyces verruculosus]